MICSNFHQTAVRRVVVVLGQGSCSTLFPNHLSDPTAQDRAKTEEKSSPPNHFCKQILFIYSLFTLSRGGGRVTNDLTAKPRQTLGRLLAAVFMVGESPDTGRRKAYAGYLQQQWSRLGHKRPRMFRTSVFYHRRATM